MGGLLGKGGPKGMFPPSQIIWGAAPPSPAPSLSTPMIPGLCGIGASLGRDAKLNMAWLLPLKVYPFTFTRTNLIYQVAFQENISITR